MLTFAPSIARLSTGARLVGRKFGCRAKRAHFGSIRRRLLFLTLVAFALRIYRIDYQSLWRDEVDAIRFATRTLPELLDTFAKHGENGPLFFLSLRPWLELAGQSEFALRFPAAAAGTLAVPVIYALVRRIAGVQPALVTALLAATAPYFVWYGQEGKMYAALTLLAPLSLWLLLRAAARGRWWHWVLLYVVTSLSFYTHLLAVLILPVQALWLLIWPEKRAAKARWASVTGYVAALLLPYTPMIRWQTRMWLRPAADTGYPFVPLDDIFRVLAVAFTRGIQPATPVMLLPGLVAVVAGLAVWTIRGSGDAKGEGASGWRPRVMLLGWLMLPPIALFGISLRRTIFTDRYLIWTGPAFLALAALGVIALRRLWRPLGLAILAAILTLNLAGIWGQTHQPIKSDFRAATRFVLAHRHCDDALLFQIPYSRHPFGYYANLLSAGGSGASRPVAGDECAEIFRLDKTTVLEGPYTNNGMSEPALADQMASETAGKRGVWLIASETDLWDQRGLTQAWLENHGRVTAREKFARVTVSRYQLPPR